MVLFIYLPIDIGHAREVKFLVFFLNQVSATELCFAAVVCSRLLWTNFIHPNSIYSIGDGVGVGGEGRGREQQG